MRHLGLRTLLELHTRILETTGGRPGLLNPAALEASLRQVQMTFQGRELYPTLVEKAAALGYCIIANHPFLDGNKRVGHAAMETLLVLNGGRIAAEVDEQERIILDVAAGQIDLRAFTAWLRDHCEGGSDVV